jgi:hypothetical protein
MSRNHLHMEMYIQLKKHCVDYIHLNDNTEQGLNTITVSINRHVRTRKSITFWDVTSCSPLEVNWHSGGWYCLHLQGQRVSQLLAGFLPGLIFDPDEVQSSRMALHPKRYYLSQSPLWEPQIQHVRNQITLTWAMASSLN